MKRVIRMSELTEEIKNKLIEIANKKKLDFEDVLDEYNSILEELPSNLPNKEKYALNILMVRLTNVLPSKEREIIPIGYKDVYTTKSGGKRAELFVISLDPVEGSKVKKVILNDKFAECVYVFNLFNKYKLRLGEFNDGTLVFDKRSERDLNKSEPEPLSLDPIEILSKLFKKVTISELENSDISSKKTPDGRTDDLDWYLIEGAILRKYLREKEDGRIISFIRLIDDTVDIEEKVLPDGTIVPPGLMVWTQPSQVEDIEVEDIVLVGGVVDRDQNNQPIMTSFVIIKIV